MRKNHNCFLFHKLAFLFFTLVSFNAVATINGPALNSPSDNDTGVSTSTYFYITGISSLADSIEVEYAENINMTSSTLIVRERYSTGAFIYTTNLKLNTDYYWRVRVVSEIDSSVWSTIQKFTTTAIFRTIQPSNNVTSLNASFVLFRANRVYQYDTVLWQIDTTSSFNSPLLRNVIVPDSDSFREVTTTQENFNYGQRYYWRAKSYSNTATSSWTPTLFFVTGDTIDLRYPSAAWLQDVDTEVDWATWRDDEPVQIQVDTSVHFTSPVRDTFLAEGIRQGLGPRYELTKLDYETVYHYRARSYNTADTTPWTVGTFTTKGLATDIVFADNYSDPIVAIRNRTAIEGSEGYEIVTDTSESFDSPLLTSSYSTEGRDTLKDLLFGATYYARARPYHSKDTGEWTRTRPIRINPFPITYYPFRNYTDIGINDSMQIDNMNGVDAYQVQVADSGDYANRMFLDTILLDSTEANYYFIKGLTFKFNTQYEWRIRAWHSADTSQWSDSKKFTTAVSPTLTRPFDSDFLGDQAALDLQWEPVGGDVMYQVMLDTSVLFNSPLLLDAMVDTSALSVVDLLFRPLYYWKVRIITPSDTSEWSETWKFTVLHARLNWPRNNRTNLGVTSLDWNSINGTDGYILQVDSFADFRAPLEVSDTVKNSFFHYFTGPPSYFTFNTKYYWRVKLYHSKDTTEWSDVWNFTTSPRRAPTLLTPVDSATEVPVIATLTWNEYSGAASYAIEYAENDSFSSATKVTSTPTNTKVTLKANTRYYWRVRGRNSDGDEFYDWSEAWTFVTNEGIPAVTHISPANGAINQEKDVVLRWNKNSDATSYRVELSQSEDFLGVFRNTETVAASNYTDLANGVTYYWRVKTISNDISSPYSETWSFTVKEKTNAVVSSLADRIVLYPNPSSTFIALSGLPKNAMVKQVTNSLGQEVYAPELEGNSNRLDIRTLLPGVYIVSIRIDDTVIRKAFVKE